MPLSLTYTLQAGQPENIAHVQQNFTDVKSLMDDELGAYRTILAVSSINVADNGADYYVFRPGGAIASYGASFTTTAPAAIYIDGDDLTLSGCTSYLRLRAQVASNATAAGITFQFGLYPVTVAGGADTVVFTLGTVVSSSTVDIATPSASTVTSGVSSDFAVPSDDLYVPVVEFDGTLANNHLSLLSVQLQQKWT